MLEIYFLGDNMLNPSEAMTITIDCVRKAGGFSETINAQDTLKKVGIFSQGSQRSLKELILLDPGIGVHSKGHYLDTSDLDFDGSTTVAELRDQVSDNAKTLPATTKKALKRAEASMPISVRSALIKVLEDK